VQFQIIDDSMAGPSGKGGDLDGAFPFIVIDKKNMYWVKDQTTSKKNKSKQRQLCDITQYGF
jgi:hypothetical protein